MFGVKPFASTSEDPSPSPESRTTPASLNHVVTPSESADRLLAREDLHALETVEFVVQDPSRRIGRTVCLEILAQTFPLPHARPRVQVMVSVESGECVLHLCVRFAKLGLTIINPPFSKVECQNLRTMGVDVLGAALSSLRGQGIA